jgi:Mat/Ecp fimbriae periplasmic chaperone
VHRLFAVQVALAALVLPSTANADMVLSQVVVDLEAHEAPRDDIEVFNNGSERMFVRAEPFEILKPGTADEARVGARDPSVSGLLVSPQRLILAPGERRVIRIASMLDRSARERVYRVAITPVAGDVVAETAAVKVLVGYDVLVLVRPSQIIGGLKAERVGRNLVIHNEGNVSREIFDGSQCDRQRAACHKLPAKRLYAGASWQQAVPYDAPITYSVAAGSKVTTLDF